MILQLETISSDEGLKAKCLEHSQGQQTPDLPALAREADRVQQHAQNHMLARMTTAPSSALILTGHADAHHGRAGTLCGALQGEGPPE